MACPFSGATVCLSKYPSTHDNFYLPYSGERKNFSGKSQSTNSSTISSSHTLESHTLKKHTFAPAINKSNQRNVFPASGLIHRPFLAALISAYSAGLIPFSLLAGPSLPAAAAAAAAAAPRTIIYLCVLGPAVGPGAVRPDVERVCSENWPSETRREIPEV